MSLSTKILIGLGLGIVSGLFFGEMNAFLKGVGELFIKLLQMTVLPYIVVSLIGGLGRLTYQEAKVFAVKGGVLLLLLWMIAFAIILIIPLAFPEWETASFFSTSLVETRKEIKFLDLYIPTNPFHSLANNIVPAVVLFSIALGLALIGVEKKSVFIENMTVANDALMRVTSFVAKFLPIGVFALTANSVGTISVQEFGNLQIYLVVYIITSLIMTFWILPMLVTSLTPLTYKEVVGHTKDALITAFATGSFFIILPILAEKSKELLRKSTLNMQESEDFVDVIIPIVYNFPHLGKLLTLSFVLFAAWYADSPVLVLQYPAFIVTALFSAFGSLNGAIPFLLDTLRIPADMFQLYLIISVIIFRFGALLGAMHTLVIALLGTYSITGRLTIRWTYLLFYIILSVIIITVTIGSIKVFFTSTLENKYNKDEIIANMQLLRDPYPATVHTSLPPPRTASDLQKSTLERINETSTLRVGYFLDRLELPYAYFNSSGVFVGFNVEMAHALAREMGVTLEFVPVNDTKLEELLNKGYCDILPGLPVTTEDAQKVTFSISYMNETLALLVKDYRRNEFKSLKTMQKQDDLQFGISNDVPYYITKIKNYLPQVEIIVLDSTQDFFNMKEEPLDALVTTAEWGSAISLLYPDYTVVIPQPDILEVPVAIAMAKGDWEMAAFMNSWIELKKKDKTIKDLYDYWILGKDAEVKSPRWSIIRDVLHWVD